MEASQCTEPCRHVQDSLQRFKPGIIKQKKGDLSDCECNVVVGARSISETAALRGFSNTIISRLAILGWSELH